MGIFGFLAPTIVCLSPLLLQTSMKKEGMSSLLNEIHNSGGKVHSLALCMTWLPWASLFNVVTPIYPGKTYKCFG